MSNSKKEKFDKNPKKKNGGLFALIAVMVIIAGYIFYECYTVTHIDVETITAVTSTVYETIEAKALIVRDEHTISSNASGVTVAAVADGEKVKLGGNVAMIFSNQENAKAYSSMQYLQNQLDYYTELESKSAGMATDIEGIDKVILSDINDYIRTVNSNSLSRLADCADDLNDKITRRQMIIGENIDFSQVKSDIQNQLNSINADSCKPTGYITAEQSAIFSSYTDGFENMVDYSKVTELNVDSLQEYISRLQTQQPQDSVFGKLITSYAWYFCVVVSADDIKGISNDSTLDVAIKDTDEVFKCRVVSGADVSLGQKQTVLVLQCSEMNGSITSMRLEDIEIRFNEHTGFKVPSQAIHIDEDGSKCVYALVSNKVTKRQGEIIYSTKDYVIFSSTIKEEEDKDNKENEENKESKDDKNQIFKPAYDPKKAIRFYDQIIIKGKDLYDGKVYT